MIESRKDISRMVFDLKHPRDHDRLPRIPVRREDGLLGFLRVVPSELKGEAVNDAALMAGWRNLQKTAFFTWIDSTADSTAKWLTTVYAADAASIIFMVETDEKVPFGHLGLAHIDAESSTCEFGRVLRGDGVVPRGGMTIAAQTLLAWAAAELGIRRFYLDAFRDNATAMALYRRCGFSITETFPLKKIEEGNCVKWVRSRTDLNGAVALAVRMELAADSLAGVDRR